MKKNLKIISATAGVLTLGLGGWWVVSEYDTPAAEETSIQKDALPASLQVIDESTKSDAIAKLYWERQATQTVDAEGNRYFEPIDASLIEETGIENYPFPMALEGKREPEMTMLLSAFLSRIDGSTNETEDTMIRIVDKKTFTQWEKLFPEWANGTIDEKELEKRWMKIQKTVPDSGLSKPMFVKHEFKHESSAFQMMDNVLQAIQEQGASTAPHIAFVQVLYDEEDLEYTLYYAESHIE